MFLFTAVTQNKESYMNFGIEIAFEIANYPNF